MRLSNGYHDTVIYYDGSKQYQRVDTYANTVIVRNTTVYNVVSPNMNQVQPLLCSFGPVFAGFSYTPLPSYFSMSYGAAFYAGQTLYVFGTPDSSIWYFDATNNPKIAVLYGVPSYITSLDPTPPNPSVFNVPSSCSLVKDTKHFQTQRRYSSSHMRNFK